MIPFKNHSALLLSFNRSNRQIVLSLSLSPSPSGSVQILNDSMAQFMYNQNPIYGMPIDNGMEEGYVSWLSLAKKIENLIPDH